MSGISYLYLWGYSTWNSTHTMSWASCGRFWKKILPVEYEFQIYLALLYEIFSLLFEKLLFKYDTDKRVYAIGDIANSKCHQRQNEILIFFLLTLHAGNQQSCLQENWVLCNTPAKLDAILCNHSVVVIAQVLYSIRLTRVFLETALLISQICR